MKAINQLNNNKLLKKIKNKRSQYQLIKKKAMKSQKINSI